MVAVLSGDTVLLRDANDVEGKYPMASIRCPRCALGYHCLILIVKLCSMGGRREDPEPHALEARETIRKKVIGKKVRVLVEYSRELRPNLGAAAAADEKKTAPAQIQHYVTLFQGKQYAQAIHFSDVWYRNLSELLVSKGLATVIRHRMSEPRAMAYEALQAAQQKYARFDSN